MLKNKTIILGITGSIAAYKIANLASMLVKLNADVHVIMTKNSCNFINPITFETLTKNKCLVDTFDRDFEFKVEHVSLASKADIFLVAPATANVIGKISNGICDDMLTTTLFACKCPVLISPAMNQNMFTNPILQDNLDKLTKYNYKIISPDNGYLACGDVGIGKMPSEDILLENILSEIAFAHDFKEKKVLISAGPTKEKIDPVRYITNHSTGKMGYSLAKAFKLRGADVTIVSGDVNLKPFLGINVIKKESALDMFEAIKLIYKNFDYIIMTAAVADYTPCSYEENKIKKNNDTLTLELTKTNDILKYLGENKTEKQHIIGFSMETQNLIENSKQKLIKKNVSMICANLLSDKTGFKSDTNEFYIITNNNVVNLSLDTKENLSHQIIDEIKKL